ncbi:MAG: hypothetical protein CVT82_00380 [Alphaproteobacteria bacterium HGW-Alphaproteobacteria-4]|jgi:hypothetical protein|nr:MAG: hypothetical protein CVT82_00380 [Alphaproteobacteria bacterium HGW-Alphaproteobacteria-4]
MGDLEIGALVLVGNDAWCHASFATRACAWAFGQHQVFTHLGLKLRISIWRGRPYLLTLREVAA